MITANELRLGNLLDSKTDNRYHEVTNWTIREAQIDSKLFNQIYTPIPITTEWLERLGFTIDKANFKGETVYVKGKCMLIESGDLIIINGWLDEENLTFSGYEVNDADNKYRYIHQLQNLYFALTGTELNIKP